MEIREGITRGQRKPGLARLPIMQVLYQIAYDLFADDIDFDEIDNCRYQVA